MSSDWSRAVDLVVLGSSSGGLTAALVAHDRGLQVLVLEKEDLLGGGGAMSGGIIWVPMNSQQRKAGLPDSPEMALRYIRATSFGRHTEDKAAAYVNMGHKALAYLEAHTPLHLHRRPDSEDYYRHYDGAVPGRAVAADPAVMPDLLAAAERAKPLLSKVRTGWMGSAAIGGWRASGRALLGSLVSACVDRAIPIEIGVRAVGLLREEGRVVGVSVERHGQQELIGSRHAVLIATGGFEHNHEMNQRYLPYAGTFFPISPDCNTGDGHIMAMELGAATALMDVTIQMTVPVSLDGTRPISGLNPAKAGAIIVNPAGRRCCDEVFYAGPGKALRSSLAGRESKYSNFPLWVIADAKAAGPDAAANPQVLSAPTLPDLAQKIGVNPEGLVAEVTRFNVHARQGLDPDFGRDYKTPFSTLPEPHELGPVEVGPFYASRVGLSTAGHQGGIVTNVHAQASDVRGKVIPGLYCTSNAAAHLAFGASYTSGQSNGNSLVFGFVAANHIADSNQLVGRSYT